MSKTLLRIMSLLFIASSIFTILSSAVSISTILGTAEGFELTTGDKVALNSSILTLIHSVEAVFLFLSLFLITFIKDREEKKAQHVVMSMIQICIPIATFVIGFAVNNVFSYVWAQTQTIIVPVGTEIFCVVLHLINISLIIVTLLSDSRERKALKETEKASKK